MKLFYLILTFLYSLNFAMASVEVEAQFKDIGKEFFLNVTIKNTGKYDIYIPTLNKKLVDLRLDLWSLGIGVELYSKEDAKWRRAQAFVNYKWQLVKPGENIHAVINLSEMMPSDPDNDETVKKIVGEFIFLKKGRAYVNVIIRKIMKKPPLKKQLYRRVEITIHDKKSKSKSERGQIRR